MNAIAEAQTCELEVPAISDDHIVALAEMAEKRIEAVKKLKILALRVTNKYDWTDQNGRPYPQVSGSEKIARLFGISWRIDEPQLEFEEGGHFSYTYSGTFSIRGVSIEAIGTRSSKDGFFSHGGKLPPSEIDRGDVKKAAYTNCIGNGITRLLGIRNLTWDDLLEAGISRADVIRIDYKRDGKKQEDIKSEDARTVSIWVSDVRKRSGEKNGKPWTQYIIKSGDDQFITFSETHAKTAKEAMDAGLQVKITHKETKFGNDIEAIEKLEPEHIYVPCEREPGEEG